jgi:exosortase
MRRWLWLGLFALAFAPTAGWLWERWTDSVFRNGHGIFMPFVLAYLVREHLRQDTDPEPRSSAWGFAFIVPAFVLLALDTGIKSEVLGALALVLALPGISLLLLGARRTRGIAFPLAIAVFMVPIPAGAIDRMVGVLRVITAIGTTWLVPLFGSSIARVGTTLTVPDLTVEVADNCSGFATLYAALLTSLILAQLTRSRGRRLALLASAVPLALICNIGRVTALVLIAKHYGAQVLETSIHPASGVALFGVVIVALFAIAGPEALRSVAPTGVRTPLSDRYSGALAFLAALAFVPVGLHSYARLRVDDCANPAALVPAEASVDSERAAFMARSFDALQWREDVLAPANGAPALKTVLIRSFDPKRLYYRGTRRLWTDVQPGGDTVEWLDSDDGRVPIQRSRLEHERPEASGAVVAALLIYGGEPVETGWRAQLGAAPRQLVSGARPMTMFAVRADTTPANRAAAEARARTYLLESWRNYRAICGR